MEQSILKSTKKILGVAEDYTVFDLDIITHINAAFSTLTQLGIGPPEGFMIEDDSEEWGSFIADDSQYNSVKSYVFLRVKLLFDPPATSFNIAALERQIEEHEWRLNSHREETDWVHPTPPELESSDVFGDQVVLDGGGAQEYICTLLNCAETILGGGRV